MIGGIGSRVSYGGVPEHQALVTGPLPIELVALGVWVVLTVLEGVVHALGNVRRLRTDGHGHTAGRPVEPFFQES